MKKLVIILFALIVVVGVALVYVYTQLDRIIQTAIETIGSDLTQTEVRLDEVEISPTSGNGALRGFRVTNPQGFSADDAFRFDEVNVTVDVATIQSDPVVIKEVVIDGPRIIYEFAGGTSNLDTLKNNMQSKSGGGSGGGSGDDASDKGPNIVIENLYLRDGTVGVTAPALGKPVEVPLLTVHMTDIGKGGKGATPDEVAKQVMERVLANARKAVADANLNLGDLRKTADELTGQARKQLENTTRNMGGAAEKDADDAGKAIEGLIERIGGQ